MFVILSRDLELEAAGGRRGEPPESQSAESLYTACKQQQEQAAAAALHQQAAAERELLDCDSLLAADHHRDLGRRLVIDEGEDGTVPVGIHIPQKREQIEQKPPPPLRCSMWIENHICS